MSEGFWHKKLVMQVSIFAAIAFVAQLLIFNGGLVHYTFLAAGFITVIGFFVFNNRLFHWWHHFNSRQFETRLVIMALLLRITAAVALYYFYLYQTGEEFEYAAIDSKFYHFNALKIASHLKMMDINFDKYLYELPFSDRGYNIYLGTLYAFGGSSVLFTRIINAIFSSFTVLFIYRTTKNISNEHTARIAAIMALLLPNFFLYLGTGLKETIMAFIVSALIYCITCLVAQQKRNLLIISSIIFLLFSLFMFRTVLAAVITVSFIIYGLMTNPLKNKTANIITTLFLLLAFGYLVYSGQAGTEISEYLSKAGNINDHMQFRATRDGGNKLAVLAGAPLFMSIIIMAPFPSFIYVPDQDILWMFIGSNMIRNIYALFAITGIIFLIKKDFRKGSLILLYTLGYLGVLANSGFALSERFHFPAIPGLIILASIGISNYEQLVKKYFPYYLCLVGIIIIGWSYVKLAGRT